MIKPADFILIQVNQDDEYYELARVNAYIDKNNKWDKKRGLYCHGIAQNNGIINEFDIHLGPSESEIKYNYINISYPIFANHDGQKVRIVSQKTEPCNQDKIGKKTNLLEAKQILENAIYENCGKHYIGNLAIQKVLQKQGFINLINQLKTDPEYRQTWVANIAMSYIDNEHQYKKENNKKYLNWSDKHDIANRAAEHFINMLCS